MLSLEHSLWSDCRLLLCTYSEVEVSMCNPVSHVPQVLERANKNEYGLAAGVWAKGGWCSAAHACDRKLSLHRGHVRD
jgi:hypothetical protein